MTDWKIRSDGNTSTGRVSGQPIIKVVGVGGAGTNAVCYMMDVGIDGVNFICTNTDTQHLEKAEQAVRIPMGDSITNGLGAGSIPQVGCDAAMQDRERIKAELEGADMVFIAAGMGGGTGTGAAPVIADLAREVDALTVAVVTKPFLFEGERRMDIAEEGLENLVKTVHSLIVIPNQKLIEHFGKNFRMGEAFGKANEVLHGAVRGISDVATKTGFINVDFQDVRTVMSVHGTAMMGSGSAEGESRAEEAVKQALACPLLEEMDIRNAGGVLVNLSAADADLGEMQTVMERVQEHAGKDAHVITGCLEDESCGDELRVTVIMTGLNRNSNQPRLVPQQAEDAQAAVVNGEDAQQDLSTLDIPSILTKQLS